MRFIIEKEMLLTAMYSTLKNLWYWTGNSAIFLSSMFEGIPQPYIPISAVLVFLISIGVQIWKLVKERQLAKGAKLDNEEKEIQNLILRQQLEQEILATAKEKEELEIFYKKNKEEEE